jgi:hypothetical protein
MTATTIPVPPELVAVLNETKALDTPQHFQELLDRSQAEMQRIVHEVGGPNQPVRDTLIELRYLYLYTGTYAEALAAKGYGAERRRWLRDAIRLLDTAETWFGEATGAGVFNIRPVADVVDASRPWRAQIGGIGGHAFVFEDGIAEQFADVNSTGTLTEEQSDLRTLNALVTKYEERLRQHGLTDALIAQGKVLLAEATGRDFLAIFGLQNQADAINLRNRVLTFATQLGKEARAAGINACFDDPAGRAKFEARSFRNALRRLRPHRHAAAAGTPANPAMPADPGAADATGSPAIAATAARAR